MHERTERRSTGQSKGSSALCKAWSSSALWVHCARRGAVGYPIARYKDFGGDGSCKVDEEGRVLFALDHPAEKPHLSERSEVGGEVARRCEVERVRWRG